jgi:hypothetical protein
MENDFNLENRQNFRIDPHVWLHTLLAIVGDKEKKQQVVQKVVRVTGCSPEQVEVILLTAITLLMNQTRSN